MIYGIMIYLTGFFISYKICRWHFKSKGMWEWVDFRFCLFISLFSWIGVTVSLLAISMEPNNSKTKPPDWL